MAFLRWIGVFVVVALFGCGQGERPSESERAGQPDPAWTVVSDPARGYRVGFPDSWHRAAERMSRISEPRELFSLGTVALRWRPADCDAFAGAAGASMGSGDVVLTVWERGYDRDSAWPDFPARPEGFRPVEDAEPAGRGCGEPAGTMIHWRNFTDSGRHFHTLVRIAPDAPPSAAAQAWRILDSLRLDADYQPSWPASG